MNKFDKWNEYQGLNKISKSSLMKSSNHEYLFSVLKAKVGEPFLFFAFENGKIVSYEGVPSYREAIRKHVIPRLIELVNEDKKCAVMTSPDSEKIVEVINKNNIDTFTSRYYYEELLKKYDISLISDILDAIDDWNQVLNVDGDVTRINPHDIRISTDTNITIQRLYSKDPHYSFEVLLPHYFVNGIPLEMYGDSEVIRENGLVPSLTLPTKYKGFKKITEICKFIQGPSYCEFIDDPNKNVNEEPLDIKPIRKN